MAVRLGVHYHRSVTASTWRLAACWMLPMFLVAGRGTGAEERWLTIDDQSFCSAVAPSLGQRIEAAVAGKTRRELSVNIVLIAEAEATVALIELRAGSRLVGSKRLVAPSCSEALDAVVAVAALALSSPSEVTEPAPAESSPPELQHRALHMAQAPRQAAQPLVLDRAPRADGARERALWLSGGLERGTFDDPMAFFGIGTAYGYGAGEFRGAIWYGVASRSEHVTAEEGQPSQSLSESSDHAAVNFDYCYPVDRGRWLGACAGLELGMAWRSRTQTHDGGHSTHSTSWEPTLGPSFGGLLAIRGAPLQPELSLSAKWLAIGGQESSRLALRAAVGAAVPF